LRQWLRCCAAALRDKQVIGMPSHAVNEDVARTDPLHHKVFGVPGCRNRG